MITFTKQPDGKYTKTGEFTAAQPEVRIQIGDSKPFASTYTLTQALSIIEDAIAKGQVAKDVYKILPVEAVAPKEPKTPRAPKAPKEPKAPKAPKAPKEPKVKTPRVLKYDVSKFAEIYAANGNNADVVVKETGASKAYVQRSLTKLGVWVAPVRVIKVKANVELTEEEVTRVNAIQTEQNIDRVAAIKVMRKEQRAANRPAKEPKGPRVTKYDVKQFAAIYAETSDANAVVAATGASKVYVIRALTALGVYTKPVKVAKVVPAPVEAPVEATPAPAEPKAPKAAKAKKSKPTQTAPPVETK